MSQPGPTLREELATIGLAVGGPGQGHGTRKLLRANGEVFAELDQEIAGLGFKTGILAREMAYEGPLKKWAIDELLELAMVARNARLA